MTTESTSADDAARRDGSRLSEGLGAWQPIATVPEGEHVLLWFPNGGRGFGGMECGTLYFYDAHAPGGINIWTHGGPNAGSDWQLDEPPTHWMPLPAPPESA